MMRRSIRSLIYLSGLVVVLVLGAAVPAAAKEVAAPTTPDQEFKAALAAYDAGDYASAMELFTRVYRETQAPALLFNIAQAARLRGDCARAVAHYRRFIVEAPTSADRPRAEAWIASLGSCDDGGGAASSASAPPAAPAPRPVAGVVAATAAPAPAAGPSPRPMRARTVTGAILLGAAATMAGASAVSAWQAASASSQISSLFRSGGDYDSSAAAIDRNGRRAETLALVLLTGTVVSAVAGVIALRWKAAAP